jgi:hypothetical protein
MPSRVPIVVAVLIATAMSSTGCAQPSRSDLGTLPGPSTDATTPASVPDDPSPSPGLSTRARARPPAKAPSPSARSTVADEERACTEETLLPLMKRKFDDPANKLIIERVEIKRCRNHYAHVFAITAANPSGQPQYENEQLFLRYVNGHWESVAEGTGISCDDPDLLAELRTACRALGYLN